MKNSKIAVLKGFSRMFWFCVFVVAHTCMKHCLTFLIQTCEVFVIILRAEAVKEIYCRCDFSFPMQKNYFYFCPMLNVKRKNSVVTKSYQFCRNLSVTHDQTELYKQKENWAADTRAYCRINSFFFFLVYPKIYYLSVNQADHWAYP